MKEKYLHHNKFSWRTARFSVDHDIGFATELIDHWINQLRANLINQCLNLSSCCMQLLLDGDPQAAAHRGVLEKYREKAEHYLCACLGRNINGADNVDRSPGGMLYVRQWNNLQYASSAAFLLTAYSHYLSSSSASASAALRCPGGAAAAAEMVSLARSQADYILGRNPLRLSYMVGYGRRYPARVHHRGASIVSHKEDGRFIGCVQGFDDWFGRGRANPNVLAGAIVGGPSRRDEFRDDRANYMQTEACTYNTAPMVAVFARLHRLTTAITTAAAAEDPDGGSPDRRSVDRR
uniref:Endoglucanase n=1 Tax=Oryza rufipogon TaxID=4529 RepID=A0A0E0QR10_ORYRU